MDFNESTINFAFGHGKFNYSRPENRGFCAYFALIFDGSFVFLFSHFTVG